MKNCDEGKKESVTEYDGTAMGLGWVVGCGNRAERLGSVHLGGTMSYAIAFYSHDEAGFVGVETFASYDDADLVYDDWTHKLHSSMVDILPISECVRIKA